MTWNEIKHKTCNWMWWQCIFSFKISCIIKLKLANIKDYLILDTVEHQWRFNFAMFKIPFKKIMHHTIQTKFTDQTTGIMKLKPMHVILYQKKQQKLDIEMKSLQTCASKSTSTWNSKKYYTLTWDVYLNEKTALIDTWSDGKISLGIPPVWVMAPSGGSASTPTLSRQLELKKT